MASVRCKRKRKELLKPEAPKILPSLRANPKIRCRSSPKRVIDIVKAKLDIHNRERFHNSCFGPYLNVQKLIFQGPIAYFLLQGLNKEASHDERVLRFNLNGREACFGPKEYLSITGLRFGASHELPSRSSLREITFGRNHKIYVRDIEKKFKEICSRDGGGGPVALKLALCLFLFGVVLGPGYRDRAIDMNYFHIFDDVDAVNSFPWGRVSYDFMISEFYSCKDRMQSQLHANEKVSVDINGFGLALQIWVYEVFPDIANLRSYMIDESMLAFPRILRWLNPHKPRYALFEDLFVSHVPIKKVPFTFSQQEVHEIEEALPYNVDFQWDGTEAYPPAIEQMIARPAKRKLHFKLRDEDAMPSAEGISNFLPKGGDSISCLLHDLNIIIPSSSTECSYSEHTPSLELLTYPIGVQSKIPSIATPSSKYDTRARFTASPEVVTLMNDKAISQPTTSVNKSIDLNDLAFPELQFLSKSSINVRAQLNSDPFLEKANTCIGSPLYFDSFWIDENFPVLDELKALSPSELSYSTETEPSSCNSGFISWDRGDRGESRRRFLKKLDSNANSECSYNMETTSEFRSTPTNKDVYSPVQFNKYSPMKKYSRELVNRFLIWYHAAKKGHPDGKKKLELRTFSIPLQAHSTITLDLIRTIYIPNEKLQDEHCDLLLNLLMHKAREAPGMFNTMWTCVECLFWCKSVYSSYEDASPLMMRYVIGELPREGALPWCDAVEVFGIAHVCKKHWVAYEIDLLAENITVYDSLSRFYEWPKVKEHFLPLSKFVPRLLKEARELYPTRFRDISLDEWPVLQPTELPQEQTGINDCGILAMKYLECLTSGYPVGLINPDYSSNFRRYFCAQIYDVGHADEGEFEIC